MQAAVFAVVLWSCIFFSCAPIAAMHMKSQDLNIEWGVSGRKGMRKEMQDAFAVQSQDGQIIFSLYDGHGRGGAEAAFTAASFLPQEIFMNDEERAYLLVDDYIEQSGCTAGTTAVTARVVQEANGACALTLAWAGDSRAIVTYKNGLSDIETLDHKPEDPFEQERILNAGGTIFSQALRMQNGQRRNLLRVRQVTADCGSVSRTGPVGGLSFTRALGDVKWPNSLISPEPDIITTVVQPGQDAYLILASDGLWDTVSTAEAAHIVSHACPLFESLDAVSREGLEDDSDACEKDGESTCEGGSDASMVLAARALRDVAYSYGSTDNITALVVRFIWKEKKDEVADSSEDQSVLPEYGGLMCCVL